MSRWVVVGSGGMLGQDMVARLDGVGQVRALPRTELDVTDFASCVAAVSGADVVVNCAAWTDVDGAQTQEAQAFAVNAVGARNLAVAAAGAGARLVQVSTDYVFDGTGVSPYGEDVPVAPVSAYGRTKAAGEWAVLAASPEHLVVRTAWLYGAGGGCFPRTIARVAAQRGALEVVDDQRGQPTWTRDLADLIVRLVLADAPGGVLHGTASGETTWFGFAQEVVARAGMDPRIVEPTATSISARPAPRPAYSVLGHDRFTQVRVDPIGDWRERWRVAADEVIGSVVEQAQ